MGLGPPNLAATVDRFSTPGTRRRFAAATTNADGFRVDGAPTDTPAQGHTFPATGDTATRFELQDIAGLYEVHTTTQLLPADPDTGRPADRWLVTIAGVPRVFEVLQAAQWIGGSDGATNYYAAPLQEVKTA